MGSGDDRRSEHELLDRALDGDREAALRLLHGYRGLIQHAAQILDRDQRLDLFVDLVMEADRLLRSYDRQRPLGPYLRVIARHRAVRMVRERHPRPVDLDELERYLVGRRPTDDRYADDPADRTIDRDLLERLVDGLTEDERIILLTCLGRLDDDEAADLLETTPAAIRIRRSRLRKKLHPNTGEGHR